MILAYALRGAKSDVALGLLFSIILACLLFQKPLFSQPKSLIGLPLFLLLPLVPLFQFPHVERFLAGYSRIVLFLCAFYFAFLEYSEFNFLRLKRVVIGLALVESFCLMLNYKALHNFGGWLHGNPHYTAMLFGPAFLFLIELLGQSKKKVQRSLFCAAFVVVGIAAYLLSSRSLYIGLMAAGIWLLKSKKEIRWIALGSLAVFALCFPYSYGEYSGRLLIWKTSLPAIAEHPITGYGLGNFELAYRLFQLPTTDILRFEKSTMFAHNDYLQLLTTLGMLGALVGLHFLFQLVFMVRSKAQTNLDSFSVIIYFAITSLFNFNFYLPFGIILIGILLGQLIAQNVSTDTPAFHIPRYPFIVAVAFLSAFYFLLFISKYYQQKGSVTRACSFGFFRADLWYDVASRALNRYPPVYDVAFGMLNKSLRWDPYDPFSWNKHAYVMWTKRQPEALVRESFENAIKLYPSHATFWIDKANFEERQGNKTAALNDLTRAISLEPRAPLAYYKRAMIYKSQQDLAQAQKDLVTAAGLMKLYQDKIIPSGYSDYLFGANDAQMKKELIIVRTTQ